MQVMLLAAGRSTRLGDLGRKLPKPLVPVCGHAPIAYALHLVARAGLRDVVVNLHHHADLLRAAVTAIARDLGLDVRFSHEAELLGTGGGLAHARPLFRSEPVLVMNAKVVADLDLRDVVARFENARVGTVAAMVLREAPDAESFAPVEIDAGARVIGMRGQRVASAKSDGRRFMFTGVHIVTKALLDRLPAQGESDVIAEAYLPAIHAGQNVLAIEHTGYFAEHSTPRRYLEGNLALLRNPQLIRQPPGRLVGVAPSVTLPGSVTIRKPVLIGEGAQIGEGCTVGPDVVVDAHAFVAPGVSLERALVWPGVSVNVSVRDAIAIEDGRVIAVEE